MMTFEGGSVSFFFKYVVPGRSMMLFGWSQSMGIWVPQIGLGRLLKMNKIEDMKLGAVQSR